MTNSTVRPVDSDTYRPPTVADGAVREQIRQAVGRDLLRCYGTVNADQLRSVDAVPHEVVALAEWLAREDADAAAGGRQR